MLNYVWFALILLGIGTALVIDINDKNVNRYGNQKSIEVSVKKISASGSEKKQEYEIVIHSNVYNDTFQDKLKGKVTLSGIVTLDSTKQNWAILLKTSDSTPPLLKEIAKASGDKNDITGTIKNFKTDSTGFAKTTMILEQVSFVKLRNITDEVLNYASIAVNIALGLIGIMALWLGVMKIAEQAGLISLLAKLVKPITRRLFPDVPSDHPAIGSMIMNISANTLGLGNAATPFGLKAMEQLNELNPDKTTASNSMITFLAINTAGITLIPATAIAIRAASGSSDPAIIIGTSLFASCCATIAGVTAAKFFEKIGSTKTSTTNKKSSLLKPLLLIAAAIIFVFVVLYFGGTGMLMLLSTLFNPQAVKEVIQTISFFAIPLLIISFITFGAVKKVKVYEQFIEGAKEGFNIAVRIIPYLVAMLMAIGIFRAGGAMDWLVYVLQPVMNSIGMPAEVLPMALMRPLSGSGSLGIMTEIISVHGADSFMGVLVSTFYGSTETTFYVLAVYFGAVNIKKTRHALPAGLIADIVGILAALFIVKQLF